jgi:uncharacterized membrane protein
MKRIPRLTARDWIGLALVLAGLILRLRQYLANRSLWLDEAMLTNNILARSFGGLFQPLDNNQGAPIGFLLLQKSITLTIGNSEYALRLFPLVAGIVALVAMFVLTRKISNSFTGLFALAFFAFSPELVYYASEVKQYSSDVAMAILLILLYLKIDSPTHRSVTARNEAVSSSKRGLLRERFAHPRNDEIKKTGYKSEPTEIKIKDAALLALAGTFAMWFSHPALFIVAALGLALFLPALRARDQKQILLLLAVGTTWVVSLGALYFLNLRQLSTHQFFLDYWAAGFMPHNLSAFAWLGNSLKAPFHDLLSLQTDYFVTALLFLVGLINRWRWNPRFGFFLLLILFFSLLASSLTLYPFAGRMILFLSPILILLLAEGIEAIAGLLTRPTWLTWTVRVLLAGYLLFGPLSTSIENFVTPKYQEHIRPTMAYLRDYRKDGDLVYVYYWAEHAVRYYAPKYGMSMSDFIIGADHHEHPEDYRVELDALRGHDRVWFLFSHVYENGNFNERDFILEYLDSIGELSREYRVPGTSVYLYLYNLR